ncbi:hypothetical protein ACWEGQ_28545, partial [Streptomyces seoulensis]
MSTPHDRTPPPTSGRPRRGVLATTFTVLRQRRRTLADATARVVGLAGLTGLLATAAVFALAWPVFTRMRDQRVRYHRAEEPYPHDHTDLAWVALCTLPLFLLLLGAGTAALQNACSRAVAAEARPRGDRPRATVLARIRPVLAVYTLRGLIVWSPPLLAETVAHRLTGYQLDTPEPLERGSWPYTLVAASPAAAVCVAVLLRLALALAPA